MGKLSNTINTSRRLLGCSIVLFSTPLVRKECSSFTLQQIFIPQPWMFTKANFQLMFMKFIMPRARGGSSKQSSDRKNKSQNKCGIADSHCISPQHYGDAGKLVGHL
uniref:Uncharacterized protein n=1 Tax=Sphaerodactylus townsendi TaxID=933632 RepID=A0ACB8G3X3_9SAUR